MIGDSSTAKEVLEALEKALADFRNTIGTLEQRIEVLELKDRERPRTMVYPKDGGPLRAATPNDFSERWGTTARWTEEDFRNAVEP
jgi:hypothetical protein